MYYLRTLHQLPQSLILPSFLSTIYSFIIHHSPPYLFCLRSVPNLNPKNSSSLFWRAKTASSLLFLGRAVMTSIWLSVSVCSLWLSKIDWGEVGSKEEEEDEEEDEAAEKRLYSLSHSLSLSLFGSLLLLSKVPRLFPPSFLSSVFTASARANIKRWSLSNRVFSIFYIFKSDARLFEQIQFQTLHD